MFSCVFHLNTLTFLFPCPAFQAQWKGVLLSVGGPLLSHKLIALPPFFLWLSYLAIFLHHMKHFTFNVLREAVLEDSASANPCLKGSEFEERGDMSIGK